MRARARRRLRKAWDVIKAVITFGKYAIPDDRVREALTRAEGAAEALDPNEKALREDYGVPPDVKR